MPFLFLCARALKFDFLAKMSIIYLYLYFPFYYIIFFPKNQLLKKPKKEGRRDVRRPNRESILLKITQRGCKPSECLSSGS